MVWPGSQSSKQASLLHVTCGLLAGIPLFPSMWLLSCSRDQSQSLLQFPKASHTLMSLVAAADTVEEASPACPGSFSVLWILVNRVSYKAFPVTLERSVDQRGPVYWVIAVATTVSRIGSDSWRPTRHNPSAVDWELAFNWSGSFLVIERCVSSEKR